MLNAIMLSVVMLSVGAPTKTPMTATAWTKLSSKDETWAKFSTLEAAVCLLCTFATMKQNGLT